MAMCGCDKITDAIKTDTSRWFSPDLVIKAPKRSPINMIRSSVSVADETQELVPNATPPREEDYTYSDEDYVIGPTDVVDVSIMDLYAVGVETTLRREVSDSGYIDLPLLADRIKAEGRTQEELKEDIKDAYSPEILRDPIVSVSVVARRQSTFSVLGAVERRGTYNVIRKDMRLLEALALAGDVWQPNTKYIYVIRMSKPRVRRDPNRVARTGPRTEPLGELPVAVPPGTTLPGPTTAPASRATEPTLEDLDRLVPGRPATQPAGLPPPSAVLRLTDTSSASGTAPSTGQAVPATAPKTHKWVYTNGTWVRVEQKPATAPTTTPTPSPTPNWPETVELPRPRVPQTQPVTPQRDTDPFNWKRIEKTDLARIIAVNYRSLQNGDPRMNIVIRDNDVIQVPRDEVGEFYVMGEVARPGVYSLTGRLITVKMAVAAAGNLGALAWPENSVLIRRVGHNQEQVIPLNIEAIFRGGASDIFLKRDDLIAVGSDIRQPFFAVLRNAFRFSYGFGFVYDRNFADIAAGSAGLDSRRFTRW